MALNDACPNFNLVSNKYAATASVFAQTTVAATSSGSLGCACATVCQAESLCAFFTVTSAGQCNLYATDRKADAGTWFSSVSTSLTVAGALQFNATMNSQLQQTSTPLLTAEGCVSSCSTSSGCDFATWPTPVASFTTCYRYKFASQPGTILGFANGNPAATTSSTSSPSSSGSASSADSTATSSGNPATTIKKTATVTTGGDAAASSSASKSTASSTSTPGAGNLQDAGNSGGSSSSSSGLVVALAVIASLAVLAGLAALVFCYRQNRSKKSKAEEFVYTLPWRQHSAAKAARLNNQTRNTPEPRVASLDRQLSVNGSAATAPSPQPMLYPPAPAAAAYGFPTLNPYALPVVAAAPPQVAFTKEQYIEAGWSIEQLQVYHPELFVDGGAGAPAGAGGSEAGTIGRAL
ncbi:hypothetical protein DFJ73DRAFT_370869 [Zopfochytrium polystomum]|nr:hypothetical protein DFJ73DRAFT_370869 [Zopfochytrium polystomum]